MSSKRCRILVPIASSDPAAEIIQQVLSSLDRAGGAVTTALRLLAACVCSVTEGRSYFKNCFSH